MGKSPAIKITKAQKDRLAATLQNYLEEHFDVEAGQLAAGLMADFIGEQFGPLYYNQGVSDAMSFIIEKTEALYEIMKDEPVD